MENIYKPIRVENGKGELLKVCEGCFGCGIKRAADADYVSKSGLVFRKGKSLKESEVKLFRKSQWKFTSGECPDCGGAGMAKVSHG